MPPSNMLIPKSYLESAFCVAVSYSLDASKMGADCSSTSSYDCTTCTRPWSALSDPTILQMSSPSQGPARKQQSASSPARMSLRRHRELELTNEQQMLDITRCSAHDSSCHRFSPGT